MIVSDQKEFLISPPSFRRNIALGLFFFFLLPVFWLAWKVSPSRFMEAPVGWLLCSMCLVPAGIFLRVALPPRSAMARLRVGREGISFVPGRWVRRYLAQPLVEAVIPHQATDILLRQKGLPNGYAVVVRSADGPIGEVYAGASLTMHSAKEIRILSNGIAKATGLPVRAVRLCRLVDGTAKECAWIEPARDGLIRSALTLAYAFFPFVTGVVVAYFFPAITMVLVIGLGLVTIQSFVLYSKGASGTQTALRVAKTLVISGSGYALAFVLTGHFLGHL